MDFPCFFFFFSIFDIARLGKIRQTHWKQRIEISKICQVLKLFVENERVRRYSSSKSPTDFTVVCMVGGGHKLVPHRITFPGNFTTFKHSFQWVDGFSLTGLSVSKVEKTVEWPIVTSLLQP